MTTKLPAGWVSASLGDLIELKYGKALPQPNRTGDGYPVFGSNGVVGAHAHALSRGTTLVIGRKGSVGEVNFSATACSPIDTTYFVDDVPGGQFRFWFRALQSLGLGSLNRSTAIPGLSRSDVYPIRIPVPPLAEQQRIANKLDTVLARVDACRDRLARVAPLLKRFRQSVLASAMSGRLTEDWRHDHGSAETGAFLLSAIQGDHARAGGHARGNASEPTEEAHDLDGSLLPATWAIATMLDVCEPGRPITYGILKPGPELDEGVPYVRVADFPGNRLRLDFIKKTSSEIDEQFRRARLRPGDLLLSIRGSVGRVVEIPEELANANITQDTARLSINKRVNRRFVLMALLDEGTQRRMRAATRGVAVRGINIGDVRALQLPLPPMQEQTEIVRRVEALFAFADRLEARLAQAQTAADRLTPSLLAKAFRGELVPQDPADEPASKLLRRLAAQRDATLVRPRRQRATA